MVRVFARTIAAFLLCAWLGGPWTALQSVAWAKMLVDNSRSVSFSQAIVRTFDGQHPCSLCRAVQKGKCEEKKSSQRIGVGKVDLICLSQPVGLFRTFLEVEYFAGDSSFNPSGDSPLVPPPRAA